MTSFLRAHARKAIVAFTLLAMSCNGGSSGPAATDGGTGGTGGGTGGTSGTGGASGTPVQQCQSTIRSLCQRSAQCAMRDAAPGADNPCEILYNIAVGCDRATSDAFGACEQDIRTLSCSSLFPGNQVMIPGSCTKPFDIPYSDEQNKCFDFVATFCEREFKCQGKTPTNNDIVDCVDQVTADPQGVPCFFVKGIGPTYDQCLQEIQTAKCDSLDGGVGVTRDDAGGMNMSKFPSCKGIIILP